MKGTITIREAEEKDHDGIWKIFKEVVKTGDTYAFAPNTNRKEFPKYWFGTYIKTYVAEEEGQVLATYTIKPNQVGLGSHIANASYMVHPDAQGRGIGKLLCKHSLDTAKNTGFMAMQFNIVVSTNIAAVSLWKKFGFEIIGTIPNGFNHRQLGFVDTYIMYKQL